MEKSKSRTFLAVRNTIFNFLYQIINTVSNIILPPLIMTFFGSAINGLISTIRQIINYIQLVGAGISESTIVSLYKPLNKKDTKKISAIYNATGKTFNKAGIIFLIISLIVSFVYPVFLNSELEYFFIVKLIIILCLSGATEFFALGKYRALLVADQKIYIVNLAQIISTIFSTLFSVLLIKLKFNILFVQVVATIFCFLRLVLLYLYVHKHYKYLDSSVKPDYNAVSKRKSAMVHQVASLIIFGSQMLFISRYCGLKEASVYSVYNLIFTGINTILATIASAMISGMGNLMALESKEKVKNVYDVYEHGYYICVFIIYITAFIMCMPFVKLYTSGVTDTNYLRFELVPLFSIMGILNCLRTPGGTMINAKGHYDETKYRAIAEMCICLFGEILLVKRFGIVGILIATILAYLYRTVDVIVYSNKRILDRPVWGTFKRILLNLTIFCIMILLVSNVNLNITNYFYWIFIALVISSIATIVVVISNYIFNKKSSKLLKEYMLSIIKR